MDVNQYTAIAFEKYADMVYRLAFARMKNSADAEDVLQEVFLRYMRRGKPAESDEHERALLIRITVNCSNSLHTSAWRRHTTALDESVSDDREFPENGTLDAVLKLPVKYRTVIHLFYFEGYAVNEIAALLKTKPSTVKSQLNRGREKLRELLQGVEF